MRLVKPLPITDFSSFHANFRFTFRRLFPASVAPSFAYPKYAEKRISRKVSVLAGLLEAELCFDCVQDGHFESASGTNRSQLVKI